MPHPFIFYFYFSTLNIPSQPMGNRCFPWLPVERPISAFLLTELILIATLCSLGREAAGRHQAGHGDSFAVLRIGAQWRGLQETPLPIDALNFSSRFFHCELIRAGCMTLEVSPSPTADPSLDWVPQENEFSLLTHICDNRCAGPMARSHCSFPFAGHSSFLWGLNFLGLFFFLLF